MAYLLTHQFETRMSAAVNLGGGPTGICKKTPFPNPTVSEGIGPTTYSFLEIGNGTGPGRVTACAIAGMHAREWAQPDAVMSFALKLLAAYKTNTAFVIPAYTENGNTFGPVNMSAAKVKKLIDNVNLILVPVANPDGRAFSQSNQANNMWRKSRSPRLIPTEDRSVGVDLNRNFDIAWDFDVYYNLALRNDPSKLRSSKTPTFDTFIGKAKVAPNQHHPENEPETKNLVWLFDNRPVTFNIDLHSAQGTVMYPWGIERNGTVAAQNFQNTAHDGKRDGTLGNVYSEFFPTAAPVRLLDRHDVIAKSMSARILAATGRTYGAAPIADAIYLATGTITDFFFSRQFTIAGSPPLHSWTVEFGDAVDGFQPDPTKPNGYPKIEREIHAVLLAFFEAALAAVPPAPPAPPPPPTPPPAGAGRSSSICLLSVAAAEVIAGGHWIGALREGRAALLARRSTHAAMLAIDRGYRRLSAAIVPHVIDRRWAKRAIAYGLLAPAASLTGLMLKGGAR